MRSRVAQGEKDLIPLFAKITKKGTMSRQEIPEYFDWDEIKEIEPADDKNLSVVKQEDAMNVLFAQSHLERVCMLQIYAIVTEMHDLLGKRVYLNEEESEPALIMDKFAAYYGHIKNVGLDDDGAVVYCVATDSDVKDYHINSISIECVPSLLSTVMESITNPELDMEMASIPWDKLPIPNPNRHPVLTKLKLIEHLQFNLWWRSVTNQERENIHQRFDQSPCPDPNSLNNWWGNLAVGIKGCIFNEWRK